MIYFPPSNGVSQGAFRYLVNNNMSSSVSLTSSGFLNENRKPTNLFTFYSYYTSEKNSSFGQWLQMEFIDYVIDLTNYSLRSPSSEGYKVDWKFSVSSNSYTWTDIHTKIYVNIINGEVFPSFANNVRFIRWTCVGSSGSSGSYDYFRFREVDIFGYLYPISNYPSIPSSKIFLYNHTYFSSKQLDYFKYTFIIICFLTMIPVSFNL